MHERIKAIDSGRRRVVAGTEWPFLYSVYRVSETEWQVEESCNAEVDVLGEYSSENEALARLDALADSDLCPAPTVLG